MANNFSNLTTDGLEATQDRLGGFSVRESGPITGTIKTIYSGKAANSKAQSIHLIMDTDSGEYRETFWITNKENENFFRNKNDKNKKVPLPGFVVVEDLCLVTTDAPLSKQATAEKVVNVYDFELRKEVPRSVDMLMDLLGKKVTLGVVKELKNKRAIDPATNLYVDTAESREENVTDKVFHHPSNLTVVEARQGTTVATFFNAWVEKNKGVTRDRRTIKEGGQAGKNGAPPRAGDTGPKTPSLFGN